MSSTQQQHKTPVHSHPLSPDEAPPSKGRRIRASATAEPRPVSTAANYFTLKAQVEQDTAEASRSWDGSVRGYGKAGTGLQNQALSSNSLANMWDRSPRTTAKGLPLFVVGSPQDVFVGNVHPEVIITSSGGDLDVQVEGATSATANHILATKWHLYSDEAIQTSIAQLSHVDSPADAASSHPYHTALRVLSSAVSNLSKARLELEETRQVLMEREESRRQRAKELIEGVNIQQNRKNALGLSSQQEQEVARRVVEALFKEEYEEEFERKVQRKQSVLVSCFSYIYYIN